MTVQLPITTDVQRIGLTAADYWLLADAGVFDAYAKSELIEGEIWVVNSVWAWHAKTTARISADLTFALRQLASDLVVYTSGSVDLADDSVPEPDVSVGDDHDDKGIPLAKIRLAVEVSDSTRVHDLGKKSTVYARAGVPEYWVIDREESRIVQRWQPTADGYAKENEHPFGATMTSVTIRGVAIDTTGL